MNVSQNPNKWVKSSEEIPQQTIEWQTGGQPTRQSVSKEQGLGH